MAGIWIAWLADAARLTGYKTVEVEGWRGHGHGGFRVVELVTGHHTADGPGEYPSLNIVRKGRADLAGPLSNYGLGRSGTIYVIAAGSCWHAGASRWAGFTDLNDEAIGIEAESRGTVDDWTPQQRDCYPRLVAACLYYMRRDSSRFCGHKECALPPGRKIDPAYWDLNAFRARVAWYLADPLRRIPRTAPLQEDDMAAVPQEQWNRLYAQETQAYDYQRHHGGVTDNHYGHTLAIRLEMHRRSDAIQARVDDIRKEINGLRTDIDGLKSMVAKLVAR